MTAAPDISPAPDPTLAERSRCAALLRSIARQHATDAAEARALIQAAARSHEPGSVADLIDQGQVYKRACAKAEAFGEAARAIEEEPA